MQNRNPPLNIKDHKPPSIIINAAANQQKLATTTNNTSAQGKSASPSTIHESSDKPQESSPLRKSILKQGSIKEVDSPESRKKEVAFSAGSTQILAFGDKEARGVNLEDQKFDESQLQTRKRSKSNESGLKNNANAVEGDSDDNDEKQHRKIVTKNVSVGRVQDGVAVLLTEDFNVMELPLSMLPEDVRKGNILKFTVERNIIEEETRKESIVRIQRELLMDKGLFDDYNKKIEYFKNKKMEFLQSNTKGGANLQKALDAVNINLQESSLLDKSEIAFDDRVIIKSRTSIEPKQDRNSINSSGKSSGGPR